MAMETTISKDKINEDYIKSVDKICEEYRCDMNKLRLKYMKKFYLKEKMMKKRKKKF